MGPWASAIVATAAVLGFFLAVMAFRGLVETIESFSGRCAECGRTPLLPLPVERHSCWQCRHHTVGLTRIFGR